MPKKLSITIAGAVSLGSFEAGVMYEILHAIGQHNGRVVPDKRILVDVLTGASAGGMTAAVAAQKLIFDGQALQGPYANVLYKAWVEDIDITQLLEDHNGDSDTKSIFSSGYIQKLSRSYITSRYTGDTPPALPQKHSAAADEIRLGLALSNLNGVDYGRAPTTGHFTYTRFQDSLKRRITASPEVDSGPFWEIVRGAAVSCGAFPFAFRPVDVPRTREEFASPTLETVFQPDQTFCYTDGGTFQNQPLGMAKDFVDDIDPTHVGTEDRYYLFVSPHDKRSAASADLNAKNADFLPFGKHLLAAIFDQSQFQDWIVAEKVNEQVRLLDARADQLSRLLSDRPADAAVLQPATQLMLSILFPDAGSSDCGDEPIGAARERLRKQYAVEYNALSAETREIFIDTVLTLETVACLGEKDEMKIVGIVADDSELAGADLQAFAGFFDFKYRKHDYDLGRRKAQQFLSARDCALGTISYDPEPIDPIDEGLNNLKVAQMDEEIRERVYDRLKDRILAILETQLNFIEREAVFISVIAPKLKKVLGL